jgi:hypothetical protein
MNKIFSVLWLWCFITATGYAEGVFNITDFEASKNNPALIQGEVSFEKNYLIGGNIRITIRVDITNKGNGLMQALNIKFPIYDTHDDGEIFRGGLLDVALVDIDEDGYKDVVISGIVDKTNDKSGEIVSSGVIIAIYHYDPVHDRFSPAYFSGNEKLRDCFYKEEKPKVAGSGFVTFPTKNT